MDTNILKCLRCQSEMEEGFTLDNTYGGSFPSSWVEGEPVKSFWRGTKTKGKDQYQIRTFRCVNCGYLESYASTEKEENNIW